MNYINHILDLLKIYTIKSKLSKIIYHTNSPIEISTDFHYNPITKYNCLCSTCEETCAFFDLSHYKRDNIKNDSTFITYLKKNKLVDISIDNNINEEICLQNLYISNKLNNIYSLIISFSNDIYSKNYLNYLPTSLSYLEITDFHNKFNCTVDYLPVAMHDFTIRSDNFNKHIDKLPPYLLKFYVYDIYNSNKYSNLYSNMNNLPFNLLSLAITNKYRGEYNNLPHTLTFIKVSIYGNKQLKSIPVHHILISSCDKYITIPTKKGGHMLADKRIVRLNLNNSAKVLSLYTECEIDLSRSNIRILHMINLSELIWKKYIPSTLKYLVYSMDWRNRVINKIIDNEIGYEYYYYANANGNRMKFRNVTIHIDYIMKNQYNRNCNIPFICRYPEF